MRLSVLGVADPLAPVGPGAVGGAEQILGSLDAELVRAGHRSLVLACEGSRVRGQLIPEEARLRAAATRVAGLLARLLAGR